MEEEGEGGGGIPTTEPVASEKEEEKVEPTKDKKEKKGNWKTINHEPVSFELYPCPHRWYRVHPKGPCPQYKQVRWVPLPLSDRLKQLALPLLRRLLALWLEFGDKFPPEMRARFTKFLMDNFGLTEEFLEQILEEAKRQREEEAAGKEKGAKVGKTGKKGRKERKKKKKNKKNKKNKRSKKNKKNKNNKKKKRKKEGKKKKKEGKEDKKEKKEKKEKKGPDSGLIFKRRKPGKLPLDWPYKMGSKLLLKCIAYLSKDPDEDYNSRASEYFDVQSMAILEQFCTYVDMSLPDPDKPTQYGEALVIMALNLTDWIAKYVTTPAQAIPDDKVQEYLDLRGIRPKPPKPKKSKKEKEKEKKGKKGKKDKKKGNEKPPEEPPPEPETEVQRNWDELKSPVFVPEKSRISKRKPLEEDEDAPEIVRDDGGYGTDTEFKDIKEGVPRWQEPTLDDIKKEFLEYIVWYNPWEPEFMYFGPRKTPKGIEMFKIWDPDSDEVPSDLRVLNWNQISYGFTDNYSFIPLPVPIYYPTLRPLRPVKLENLEKSGIPNEIIKKNLRFFSPWYLMKKPLKPPPPPAPPEEEEQQFLGEYEEEIEDEMLQSTKEPPVKDSLWGDYKMREQIEILGHLLHLMASEPDLTLEFVFELLEDFCEAVECAEEDENPMEENKVLNKKRTIILEQYFVDFFGKKFRDYNERTPYYMRKICSRFAYYIQILYEHTARILWELQSGPNLPTPIVSRPETPDDPEALRDWNEWLEWLIQVTKTCDEWAGWISDTVNEAERKAAKKKLEYVGPDGKKEYLTTDEWFKWKKEVEKKVQVYKSAKKKIYHESPYYQEKAKTLLPVKHRKVVCRKEDEDYGEGMEVEFEEGEEEGEVEKVFRKPEKEMPPLDTDETEWEDVGEIEEE